MTRIVSVRIADCLSPQQKQIYYLRSVQGESLKTIAELLNVKMGTVQKQWNRIVNKIGDIESFGTEIIKEIFEEETEQKALSSKYTVRQAQFLQQKSNMSYKSERSRSANKRLEKKTQHLFRRKATPEELAEMRSNSKRIQSDLEVLNNPSIARVEMNYRLGNASTEQMAAWEIILRTYGVIRHTPYINKLNSKTNQALRAQAEGYRVTLIKSDERNSLPQGSKHLETVRNDAGISEYSVWLIPGYIPSPKRSDVGDKKTK